ncbi:MAG TPA: tetratricopeptide repeat protein [Terriglobia bacterium]|nr:tetratricopeptide repeat protein [Terriglobia bacterium]
MGRALEIAVLMLAMLGVGACTAHAQSPRPQSESGRDWTYTPPGAAKSVEIGNFYLRKKDYRGALSRFEEAVRTNPDYAPAYLGMGHVYEKMGLNRKALKAYEKYLDELPSDEDAARAKSVHKSIARLKRKLGKSKTTSKATKNLSANR